MKWFLAANALCFVGMIASRLWSDMVCTSNMSMQVEEWCKNAMQLSIIFTILAVVWLYF